MVKIFGFEINRPPEDILPTFTPAVKDDGAVILTAGGSYGTYLDFEGNIKNEAELVTNYRQMEQHPEIATAVKKITNEAIVVEEEEPIVQILLDDLPGITPKLKQVIEQEFARILELLEFQTYAYYIFERFYVDGRLYYHAIIDPKQLDAGIIEMRYVDPRKIRKVREVDKAPMDPMMAKIPGAISIQKTVNEYFVFNQNGFINNANPTVSMGYTPPVTGLKIAKDSIIHVTSGLMDKSGTMVISNLHKAIKPLNQLRALEDAAIIYRLARAPERRIFTIEIGDMPKIKAEQYMKSLMDRYKNKLVYDAATGEIKDERKFMTMLEDFWIPVREGRGTKIDTLPPGNAQGVMDEVEFFKQKLYDALEIPYSRFNPDSIFAIGQGAAEITRDELDFSKFIDRQRSRFNTLFLKTLEKQLTLKKIIDPLEWPTLSYYIKFRYARDNVFAELKEGEILNGRAMRAQMLMPFIGRYFSNRWVRKSVFKQSDDDMMINDIEIMEEMQNPQYMMMSPMDPAAGGAPGMGGMIGPPQPQLPAPAKGGSGNK